MIGKDGKLSYREERGIENAKRLLANGSVALD